MRKSVIFAVRAFEFGQKLRLYFALQSLYDVVYIRKVSARLHIVDIRGVLVHKNIVIGNTARIIRVFIGRNFYLYALFAAFVRLVRFFGGKTIRRLLKPIGGRSGSAPLTERYLRDFRSIFVFADIAVSAARSHAYRKNGSQTER